jgi:hypothetical protein
MSLFIRLLPPMCRTSDVQDKCTAGQARVCYVTCPHNANRQDRLVNTAICYQYIRFRGLHDVLSRNTGRSRHKCSMPP